MTIPAGFPVWRGGQLALNADFNWPQPVEGDVWDFRIGGYPVLARWLRQRRHRALLEPDLDYLARMIQAIRETLRIVAQLE